MLKLARIVTLFAFIMLLFRAMIGLTSGQSFTLTDQWINFIVLLCGTTWYLSDGLNK